MMDLIKQLEESQTKVIPISAFQSLSTEKHLKIKLELVKKRSEKQLIEQKMNKA
jgi:aromatic ring-opening dioxygenase catalytic subunit (LigB family)